MDALASWVGRQERAEDDIAATPIAAYAALLDRSPVRQLAIEEEHEIVYRGVSAPGSEAAAAPAKPERTAQWRREVHPDPVLLFRYSALTFNGHRIHYDRTYVAEVEGYPGLVVHGPLLGTLLIDGLAQNESGARVGSYAFKATRPVFDTAPFYVCGRRDADRASLWIEDAQGALCMDATAELA